MAEQMIEKNNASLEVTKAEENKLKAVLDALGLQYTTVDNLKGNSVTYMLELTDEEYEALSNALTRLKFKTAAVRFVEGATNAVISTTEYVAKDVAVPVAKLGLKVGVSAVRIGTECATIAGASAVNVIAEEGKTAIEVIKQSDEYVQAKANLSKLGNLLGFGGSSFSLKKI